MKYLLDTHTFLWTLFEDEQLSRNAAIAIQDPDNEIFISVISFWEISLKYSIGKIELSGISPDELPSRAAEVGIETAHVSAEQAATFHKLPRLKHKSFRSAHNLAGNQRPSNSP